MPVAGLELEEEDIEQVADCHAEGNPQPHGDDDQDAQEGQGYYADGIQDEGTDDAHDEESEEIALDVIEYTAEVLAE